MTSGQTCESIGYFPAVRNALAIHAQPLRGPVVDNTIEDMPRRGGIGYKLARWAATFAMGSWVVIGIVPVVVAICALR